MAPPRWSSASRRHWHWSVNCCSTSSLHSCTLVLRHTSDIRFCTLYTLWLYLLPDEHSLPASLWLCTHHMCCCHQRAHARRTSSCGLQVIRSILKVGACAHARTCMRMSEAALEPLEKLCVGHARQSAPGCSLNSGCTDPGCTDPWGIPGGRGAKAVSAA